MSFQWSSISFFCMLSCFLFSPFFSGNSLGFHFSYYISFAICKRLRQGHKKYHFVVIRDCFRDIIFGFMNFIAWNRRILATMWWDFLRFVLCENKNSKVKSRRVKMKCRAAAENFLLWSKYKKKQENSMSNKITDEQEKQNVTQKRFNLETWFQLNFHSSRKMKNK